MKAATCALAASMLAASTAALTTTSTPYAAPNEVPEGNSPNVKAKICVASSSEKDKFAPRFDGLRFIETLVTAHR